MQAAAFFQDEWRIQTLCGALGSRLLDAARSETCCDRKSSERVTKVRLISLGAKDFHTLYLHQTCDMYCGMEASKPLCTFWKRI